MYNSSNVPVACTVEAAQDWAKWLVQEQRIYILDGKYLYSWPGQLSEGTHRLRIKVHLTYYISYWNIGAVEAIGSSDEVVFTVTLLSRTSRFWSLGQLKPTTRPKFR